MYIVINKNTEESYAIRYAVAVAHLIECNPTTVRRNRYKNSWRRKHFVVYNVTKSLLTGLHKGNNNILFK